jgi:hypothetical protein
MRDDGREIEVGGEWSLPFRFLGEVGGDGGDSVAKEEENEASREEEDEC